MNEQLNSRIDQKNEQFEKKSEQTTEQLEEIIRNISSSNVRYKIFHFYGLFSNRCM